MLLLGDQVFLSEVFVEPVAELANTINVVIVGDLLVYGVANVAEDFRNPKLFIKSQQPLTVYLCYVLFERGS